MRRRVPALARFSQESPRTLSNYGITAPMVPSAQLADGPRLAERGVRSSSSIIATGPHGSVKDHMRGSAAEVDQRPPPSSRT